MHSGFPCAGLSPCRVRVIRGQGCFPVLSYHKVLGNWARAGSTGCSLAFLKVLAVNTNSLSLLEHPDLAYKTISLSDSAVSSLWDRNVFKQTWYSTQLMWLSRCSMYFYALMVKLKYIFPRISVYQLSGEEEKSQYANCIHRREDVDALVQRVGNGALIKYSLSPWLSLNLTLFGVTLKRIVATENKCIFPKCLLENL